MVRFFCLFIWLAVSCSSREDPLPSWNEGRAKSAILEFVKEVTTPGQPDYLREADRIAVFDQDGTLWVEKPLYTQLQFALESSQQKLDPDTFTSDKMNEIMVLSHANMSVNDFHNKAKAWLETAKHPRFNKKYTDLIYKPMIEVMRLLQSKGFRVYIVSGGGQEFIRVYSEKVYGLSADQIIGSAGKLDYVYDNGKPELMKLPEILFIDDKEGKPKAIQLIIGRRPVFAFGNSDGDKEMLEWTQSGTGRSLELLVHHDDPVREYEYGPESKVGTFSENLKAEAEKKNWIVVSIKDDWNTIF